MPFVYTKLSQINFLIAENFTSNSAENIIKELNTFNSMNKARGFNIDVFHGDKKFSLNTLREHTRQASLNIYEKGRHITIIERSI